jgi:hypothetical protein
MLRRQRTIGWWFSVSVRLATRTRQWDSRNPLASSRSKEEKETLSGLMSHGILWWGKGAGLPNLTLWLGGMHWGMRACSH